MKKEYNIIGLDCGHCALTLEKYIEKVNGVKEVSINFSTSKLFIDVDETNEKAIMKDVIKTAKSFDPNVKISQEKEKSKKDPAMLVCYVIGLFLGIVVVLSSRFNFLPTTLSWIMLITAAVLMGYKTYVLAVKQIVKGKINENTLVTLSIIGAIAVGESMEGLMVIALYTLGKILESKAVNYSRQSISKLISSQPEYAYILKPDGTSEKVKPETVNIGDKIIVKAGEKVALDGVVVSGSASVDKRHLTGETDAISIGVGDVIESGSVVLDSVITIEVTTEYQNSTVSKILNLVSNATNKKSKTETVISKFSSWYTLGVIISAVIVFGITWAVLQNVNTAVYRGLIFLVVSCPCAFAISVPLGYFSGIGRCSKSGILVKGSNFLDATAKVNTICFDKTGTITTGEFKVDSVEILNNMNKQDFLKLVVIGEQNSLHPIAKAICKYYGKEESIVVKDYKEISGKGIEYSFKGNNYIIGRSADGKGKTTVQVIENGEKIGVITLSDEIKDGSKSLVSELKSLNIKTMMLTGDSESVAQDVANSVGMDEYRAGLLPQDKFAILEEGKKDGKRIAFVGDGINDAPALTLSDVGISMGITGSPATIEASDIVIADDNLSKISDLLKISKFTKKIVIENIAFAAITKLLFLGLGAFGVTGMLLAVFADVGVTLLAILNSLRVLSFGNKRKK